jgi:uroporphyrinogen-III synthase
VWRKPCVTAARIDDAAGPGGVPPQSSTCLATPLSSLRVIVTRPEREAQAWAAALQVRGVACETLPLIGIVALPESGDLAATWQAVPEHLALMFVSANAVRFFMAARPEGLALGHCRAWSTGPGTQAALQATGWPEQLIDSPGIQAEQFDSESLWNLVSGAVATAVKAAPPDRRPSVLIVRGADAQGQLAGRDWLALQLEQAGVQVLQAVAYMRQAPVLNEQQCLRAQQTLQDGSAWLFSSSEAAQYLLQACPGLDVTRARALATHPRIAQRLQAAGWGQVHLVPAGMDAQAQSIKSLS